MEEERLFTVARWLLALTVIFIPLSIVVLISAVFIYNYPDRQWTRYLLLFSWVSSSVSFFLGMVNMVGLSLSGEEGSSGVSSAVVDDESGDEFMSETPSTSIPQTAYQRRSVGFPAGGMLMAQAFTLAVAIALYVAFLCWMLLPGIRLQM